MCSRPFLIIHLLILSLAVLPLGLTADNHKSNDPYQRAIEYRQAAFKIIGANFSPMGQMVKGERPWDKKAFARYAQDLSRVANIDIVRGFIEGSEFGRTKAKPEIWEEMGDFKKRLGAFAKATVAFNQAVMGGEDKDTIRKQYAQIGKDHCKSCHKKYRSKKFNN